ncbi:hypothetical protein [Microbacterium lushaniae]|uniref:hypothetical protein n=1 Tax=Microbacterium lushaniae TaxID=2614639 RepID=UPI00177BCCEA|nr:hypothetical protein [Microbacterium lushaniae]
MTSTTANSTIAPALSAVQQGRMTCGGAARDAREIQQAEDGRYDRTGEPFALRIAG